MFNYFYNKSNLFTTRLLVIIRFGKKDHTVESIKGVYVKFMFE